MDAATLRAAYLRHRYEVFFWSLLAAIAAIAVGIPDLAVRVLLATSLLLTLGAGRIRRALVALVVACWAVATLRAGTSEALLAATLLAFLGIVIAILIVRHSLGTPIVGRDTIFASLSGYLLLGLVCGELYWVIEQHAPGSLAFTVDSGPFALPSGVYFSFATLTTVGYGDITPRTELARGLAIIEAVAGQIYLAVFVARLIGLYISRRSEGV